MHFSEIYDYLNQQQKKTVDHIDGPVMVVAGPGTGKTQVMGARVANILQKTDSKASNILCLTFTEAATVALRTRLYQFIGPEAHRINIYTFHGFCHSVIQDNKEKFGIHNLEPVSDLELLEITKEIVDEIANDSPLKRFRGNAYYDQKDLINLFNLIKKENLDINELVASIDNYLAEWRLDPANIYKKKTKNFEKGDVKENDYKILKQKMDKLTAALQLYPVYQSKMQAKNRYDFNDMILWVLKLFHSEPNTLAFYQESFHYFLVDEYQDTNGSQNDLINLLISYWDKPNIFVVGDDDQSIYKFQGANIENIFKFYYDHKENVNVVTLTENYRSTQEILDVSKHVIQKNTERLVGIVPGLTKNIKASNTEVTGLQSSVQIDCYPNSSQEIIGISNHIKELAANGVSLENIAVLYKEHKQCDELMQYLETEGIAFSVTRTQNTFDQTMVRQIIVLLTYLNKENERLNSGDHLLFDILHFHNFTHLTPFEIGKMSVFLNAKKQGWRTALTLSNDEIEGLKRESIAELKQFIQDIDYWLKELHNVSTQSLVEVVLSKGGFISRALAASDSSFQMQCLKSFYNFLKEEMSRKPFSSLDYFLKQIDLMQKNNLNLPVNKVIQNNKGVNFMTVYASKGLEFEHVFLIGCTSEFWVKKRSRPQPFNINLVLPGNINDGKEEEERRLFYVALTRAKKRVRISYYGHNVTGKPVTESLFIIEALESQKTSVKNQEVNEEEFADFFRKMLEPNSEDFIPLFKSDFVKQILQSFRMNATNLNNYLRCPTMFFYTNIIRVPSAKSEPMTFGTAMHYALEKMYENSFLGNENGLEEAKIAFEQSLKSNADAFTKESFERRLFYGKKILKEYFEEYQSGFNIPDKLELEKAIHNVEFKGVPIRGSLDKVEYHGGGINVVDYKTGSFKDTRTRAKLKPPVDLSNLKEDETDLIKINGGDYWRQLYFYKVLIDSDPMISQSVLSGTVDYVEPQNDQFSQEKIMFNENHLTIVKDQISDSYEKIMNQQFENGCLEEDCYWCNFQKHYTSRKISKLKKTGVDDVQDIEER